MKIRIDDITESPKALAYTEESGELNARLARGSTDWHLPDGIAVDVQYYRAGMDVFVEGQVLADVDGNCGRCLETYPFRVDGPFRVVLAPRADAPDDGALSADDLGLGFYEGDEIDLTSLVHEHTILALPTRPLCSEGCRGLCTRCGMNLNAGACGCAATTDTSPFAGLGDFLRGK